MTHRMVVVAALGAALSFFPLTSSAQRRPARPRTPRTTQTARPTQTAQMPRMLAPLAGARVRTLRPSFRIALATGTAQVSLELCRDRACDHVVTTLPATSAEVTPEGDLSPGIVFWRLRWNTSQAPGASPTWALRVARPPRAASQPATAGAPGAARREIAGGARDATVASGDFDGDSRGDLATGTPDAQGGSIVVVRASASAPDSPLRLAQPAGRDRATPPDRLGPALAVGDADGDGYDDLAATRGELGMRSSGPITVLLFRGSADGLGTMPARISSPRPAPDTSRPPRGPTDFLASLAFADVDGDGRDDLAVGSPAMLRIYRGTGAGLGAPAAWEIAPPAGASFEAMRVARAGDTNGDGYEDVAVSVRSSAGPFGRVLVYLGSRTGPQPEPVAVSAGEVPIGFGAAVAAAGDVDGDGRGELLVSFSGGEARREAGVYLYRGTDDGPDARGGALLDGPRDAAVAFGASLLGERDENGDGYADFIVGAPGADGGRGAAYRFRGGASARLARPVVTRGTRPDGGFATTLAW